MKKWTIVISGLAWLLAACTTAASMTPQILSETPKAMPAFGNTATPNGTDIANNQILAVKTIYPSSTPLVVGKEIDLSPTLKDYDKYLVIVSRADGTNEEIKVGPAKHDLFETQLPDDILEMLNLRPGDKIIRWYDIAIREAHNNNPTATFTPLLSQTSTEILANTSTPTQTASDYCEQILVNYQPADGFQTYCDPDYGFALDYPNNWIKHIGSQSPDIASLPSAVRRVMIFEVDDMSNFIRTNTYHIYGGLTLQERVEHSLGYNDRAFPDKSYPSLVLGGHKAYAMMECWQQGYGSAVDLYFQHGQYYTIVEVMALNRIGLDTNWQIARSLQTPYFPPDKNIIPQELIDDSYQLLNCHVPPTQISTLAPSPTITWKTYTDNIFHISLEYPINWEIDTTGDAVYSGADGFFQITASVLFGPSANPVCEDEIQKAINKSKGGDEFGTQPTMEILQVDGQNACLILPSGDQLDSYRNEALLVVEYPSSIRSGALLLFWADKNHMPDFISTLQFMR